MTRLFREHTPIETHCIRGSVVFGKRDDLFGIDPAPPLAKLRGLRLVLNEAYAGGVRFSSIPIEIGLVFVDGADGD